MTLLHISILEDLLPGEGLELLSHLEPFLGLLMTWLKYFSCSLLTKLVRGL